MALTAKIEIGSKVFNHKTVSNLFAATLKEQVWAAEHDDANEKHFCIRLFNGEKLVAANVGHGWHFTHVEDRVNCLKLWAENGVDD